MTWLNKLMFRSQVLPECVLGTVALVTQLFILLYRSCPSAPPKGRAP